MDVQQQQSTQTLQNKKFQPALPQHTIIKEKWKIERLIGKGTFGEIYCATDVHSGKEVAIKVELNDPTKNDLKKEVIVLKRLKDSPNVVKYIYSGRHIERFNFMVMEKLDEDLEKIRKHTLNSKFSLSTTLKLGIQMLEGIESIHKIGYLHRDLKPSNFVIKRSEKGKIFVIDFGLARKYISNDGKHKEPRKQVGFRGTGRYASINSHQEKELSRRDDLWSIFYVLVEFSYGSLPWRKVKDLKRIGELKIKYTNKELLTELPEEFTTFMDYISNLGYEEEPDYLHLKNLLKQSSEKKEEYSLDHPFDWEFKEERQKESINEISEVPVRSLIQSEISDIEIENDNQNEHLNIKIENGNHHVGGTKKHIKTISTPLSLGLGNQKKLTSPKTSMDKSGRKPSLNVGSGGSNGNKKSYEMLDGKKSKECIIL
eukprot:gene2470-3179_t